MTNMPDTVREPIEPCLEMWMEYLRGNRDILDLLLADDAVLISPILFAPQVGRDLVKLYLSAATSAFSGGSSQHGDALTPLASGSATIGGDEGPDSWDGRFRYRRKLCRGDFAVLEFETTISGKYVNGVDMITCNSKGKITEFRVMVRPLQGVNAVHAQMRAVLEAREVHL
jgi:hypothetical protein